MSPGTWRVPVILLLGGLKKRMDWDWGSLLELGVCRSGVRTKTGINMGPLEESGRSRLIKEAQIGSDGITEQPKVPVTASSGIAPVNTFNPAAQSKQSDLLLVGYFSLFLNNDAQKHQLSAQLYANINFRYIYNYETSLLFPFIVQKMMMISASKVGDSKRSCNRPVMLLNIDYQIYI